MCRIIRILLIVVGILLVAAALFFLFYLLPKIVEEKVENTVRLENGTDGWERWKDLPIPIQYKIYFFNVTNPDEVQQGAKPHVREIGPYIYNQRRLKTAITIDEDRLSYFQNLSFKFDANASFPRTETEEIVIANLPLMAVLAIAEDRVNPLLQMLNSVIDDIFDSPKNLFLRTNPKDFLFDGVFLSCNSSKEVVKLTCGIIAELAPSTLVKLEDGDFKFSLLSHKSNGGEGTFVVNSGINDIDLLGEISAWEGSSTLGDTWTENSECNKISGSDSTIYPPFRTPDSKINVFSVDICRSVALEYSGDITYSGISGHRFSAGKRMLSSPSSLKYNQCYCLNRTRGIRGDDGCLLDGALELYSCQDAPIVLSLPHFYLAHETYRNGVEGLTPNGDLHEMYVDLEPYTGSPLRGHKRAQFNMFYRPIDHITLTQKLNTTLVPVVWLDEGVELTDDLIKELNEQLFDVLKIVNGIIWALLGIGLVIFVGILTWYLLSWRKNRNNRVMKRRET